jgi:hypothetical protein
VSVVDISLPHLKRFSAALEGEWAVNRYTGMDRHKRDWWGALKSNEPCVAVCLVHAEGTLSWSRSTWPPKTETEVHFIFAPFNQALDHFHASLSIANGIVSAAGPVTRLDECLVALGNPAIEGARFQWFADIGQPTLASFGVILVSKDDVRSARNHTWHLRRPLDQAVDQRIATMFKTRRSGWTAWG